MKRPPLPIRLWRKLVASIASKPPKQSQPERRPVSTIEPLEGRIAPASLISSTTLTFKEVDGDLVTVKFSKPVFAFGTPGANQAANLMFTFTGGGGVDGSNEVAQRLDLIDLTKATTSGGGNVAAGVSFTVTSKTAAGVQSTVDVGAINALNLALGSVRIDGALTQIDCGTNSSAVALKSLTVNSLNSQVGGVTSDIVGALGKLNVLGDFSQARLNVANGTTVAGKTIAIGKIGSIQIGGSLIGAAGTEVMGTNYANWGLIETDGDIGSIKIGSTLEDGIKGGFGTNSGAIMSGGGIGSITISGSVVGGTKDKSGTIQASGSIGQVKLYDLTGGDGAGSGGILGQTTIAGVTMHSIVGGKGLGSGVLESIGAMGKVQIAGNIEATLPSVGVGAGGLSSGGKLTSATINGSILGGGANSSGFINGLSDIGAVKIAGVVTGGDGESSGVITAAGEISNLSVGALVGGTKQNSGSVFSGANPALDGDIGTVKIATSITGGDGNNSGSVVTSHGKIGSVSIGANGAGVAMNGGKGAFSGAIFADGTIGAVKIIGSITGAEGVDSASIHSKGKLSSVSMTGNLLGGVGIGSGSIVSHDDLGRNVAGDIGSVTVGGLVKGLAVAGGDRAAQIHAEGALGKADIGSLGGGFGAKSGSIVVGDGLISSVGSGAIKLGSFDASASGGTGTIEVHGRLTGLTVAGLLKGATVHVADDLRSLTVGSLADAIVTARGTAVQGDRSDVAIGKVTVKGSVENSQILAGYSISGAPVNADAQIGAVKVGGSWSASDLVAGASDLGNNGFGNADDVKAPGTDRPGIVSRIASVVIGGAVSGTSAETNATDHFGFVAQQIGAFKANGVSLSLNPTATDTPPPLTEDVAVREIALTA